MPVVFTRRHNPPILDILQKMNPIYTEIDVGIRRLELINCVVKTMSNNAHQIPLQHLNLLNQHWASQYGSVFTLKFTRKGGISKSILKNFLLCGRLDASIF